MRAVIEHLCRVHGMRRLAFVRGPAGNAEAERRFAAYAAALATEGIPMEPELVVPGDFEERGGREAVGVLLGQRKLSPHALDAIVAANDAMAMGAIAGTARVLNEGMLAELEITADAVEKVYNSRKYA